MAASKPVDEIRTTIEADSLGYLSPKGLLAAVAAEGRGHCDACFTGQYPIPISATRGARSLRLVEV